jgi:hypothetical protein
MYNSAGARLYRFVRFKIFRPDNKSFEKQELRAPSRKGIDDEAIQRALFQIADRLEKALPEYDYHCAEIAPNQFNFVCDGKKPPVMPRIALELHP